MEQSTEELTAQIGKAGEKVEAARQQIGKVIVGQKLLVDRLLTGLLADGHLLLEGLPGLAKTLAVNTLAKVVGCEYKRIQFTPDLLPADLIGTTIYDMRESSFKVNKGPIFTNILLADEINRAPAKVQSAMLEVMQEQQVTISGESYRLPPPFMVLATQNPIEQEGTYPLPEAQTDRFIMKVRVDYPSIEEEKEILKRMATLVEKPKPQTVYSVEDILSARKLINDIYIDDKIIDYILRIVAATRTPKRYGVEIEGLLQFGASPRASMALKIISKVQAFLSGRAYVVPQDIKEIAADVLRHRLRRSYEAEAENVSPDDIIDAILNKVMVP